ncbi:unnamed protein product, partial [Polarella glacialis]
FASIISAFGEGLQWERAVSWLRGAQQVEGINELAAHNSAMAACERTGQWQRALLLMSLPGLEPDVFSLGSCLSARGKAGDWEGALGFLAEMLTRGLRSNVVTLATAVAACSRGGAWAASLALVALARLSRLEVVPVARLSLMAALEAAGRWVTSLQLLQEVLTGAGADEGALLAVEVGDEVRLRLHNSALAACSAGFQWQRALSLLADAQRGCLEPNTLTQKAVIDAFEMASQPWPAPRLLQAVQKDACASQEGLGFGRMRMVGRIRCG